MTMAKLEYSGTYEWSKVDTDTGEVTSAEVVEFLRRLPDEKPDNTQRRSNFAILYPLQFYGLINSVGNKKMEVISYIIRHMSADNVLIATSAQIAKKANVSKNTVDRTLQALEKANLIRRKPGIIMLNPQLINRKHKPGEFRLMVKYDEIGDDNDN